jgi:hypothetical protein
MKTMYRIVEKTDKGYKTLFHGIKGSRILPVGKWLRSEQKMVRDGSKGKYYKAGFHLIEDLEECRKFMKMRFSAPRELVIVECRVKGKCWPKEHSPHNIMLYEYMKIIGEVNRQEIPAGLPRGVSQTTNKED